MFKKFKLLLIISLLTTTLFSQEVLIYNSPDYQLKSNIKSQTTKQDTVQLPFFDDFSAPQLNPQLWRTNGVTIDFTGSIYPPSIGAVMFDATDLNGNFYATNYNVSTPSDTLTSAPINLNFPGDQTIYLSFFYEPKGLLNMPEAQDSLILQFYSPSQNTWTTVWKDTGSSTVPQKIRFKLVMIKIDSSKYLQNGFRFRFINYTSLGSPTYPSLISDCDYWFIDYVYLDRNRYSGDTIFPDVAIQYPITFKFDDYTAIPYDHYQPSHINHNLKVQFRNNDAISRTVDSLYIIFKNYQTHSTLDTLFLGSYSFPPQGNFFFQAQNIDYSLPINEPTKLLLQTKLITNASDPAQNNSTSSSLYMTDFYAYDDGTAEAGYGLVGDGTYLAQVAARFYTLKTDTLKAIMLYVNKTYRLHQPHYFYIEIWENDPDYGLPGQLIYEQVGAEINFNNLDHYQLFLLDSPVVVTDTFYIGWKKTDQQLMNVGLDLNEPIENYKFYNIDGQWKRSSIPGNLMIRPVFGTQGLISALNKISQKPAIKIYPNPAFDHCFIETNTPGRIRVINLQGKIVKTLQINHSRQIDLSNLPAGLYLINFSTKNQSISKKLIINR